MWYTYYVTPFEATQNNEGGFFMPERKTNFELFLDKVGSGGIKSIALDYATSDTFTTLRSLADAYNVSESIVSQSIKYAIEHCLITYQQSISIKEKARRNQLRHIKDGQSWSAPSDSYYEEVLANRKKFVNTLRDERMLKVVDFYINNPKLNINVISESLGFSPEEINILLRNAICYCVANNDQAIRIAKISIDKRPTESEKRKTRDFLDAYSSFRKAYSKILSEISEVEYHIQIFDETHIDEEDAPSRTDLENQLFYLQEERKKYDNYFTPKEQLFII